MYRLKRIIKHFPGVDELLGLRQYGWKFLKFKRQYKQFRALDAEKRFSLDWNLRQCYDDATNTHGFDRHYVLHSAWAARVLARTRPEQHIDISSLLYFSTLVSAFLPVAFYDYRKLSIRLKGLETGTADLLRLPFADNSVRSLSCMHVVEHLGLGRYGDPIDPQADLKAIRELTRVLAPGGLLLFVTPIGGQRIIFNAHRQYRCTAIRNYFQALELVEFAFIPDDPQHGDLLTQSDLAWVDEHIRYGCGCFAFRKPLT